MKKLTDEKIKELEHWADKKRTFEGKLTKEEEFILKKVDNYRTSGWQGIRITKAEQMQTIDLQEQLDKLKRKEV